MLDKLIPHKLSHDNKIIRLTIGNSLLARNTNQSSIDCIVTCDENDYDNFRWFEQ